MWNAARVESTVITARLPLLRAPCLATGSLAVTRGLSGHDPDGHALVVEPLTGRRTVE